MAFESGRTASRVFVSYSHRDQRWLDALLDHLRPLVRSDAITIWAASQSLRVGASWREELTAALDEARVAVLLVSHHFLASDFIMKEEVPPLLDAAASRGTTIMPVIVGPCLFQEHVALSRYQAANSPDRPLSSLRKYEQDKLLLSLAREISYRVGQSGSH